MVIGWSTIALQDELRPVELFGFIGAMYPPPTFQPKLETRHRGSGVDRRIMIFVSVLETGVHDLLGKTTLPERITTQPLGWDNGP